MNTINYGRRSADREDVDGRINLSKEQHQSLVELSPEPIVVCCDLRVVYINPAGVALIGAQYKSEIVGKVISDFLHPDHKDNAIADSVQFLEGGKPSDLFERKLIRLDGDTI